MRVDREGIHIDRDVADSIAIEEELDANIEGEYTFPEPTRRRISAWVYLAAAAITLFAFEGGWVVSIAFALLAAWHFVSSYELTIDENQAMATAGAAIDFPVGHASASVRFTGWRSRPRWSVVVYSAAEPPDKRALVVVDAVTGEVAETPYVESLGSDDAA